MLKKRKKQFEKFFISLMVLPYQFIGIRELPHFSSYPLTKLVSFAETYCTPSKF